MNDIKKYTEIVFEYIKYINDNNNSSVFGVTNIKEWVLLDFFETFEYN